ncbi:Aminopeptidase 2 mitochondrial [Tilletia horrida]|uniref:Aminopeptidase n=1 Tax=Tilletia horrida TaxID=155126 RepID=A0AAN6GHR9_9BASI|nr:Aminopeptidase 2 mitochondrial [Tilletia horrida]KAK0538736.1 Aminopeptidase 2 mitochondrial [Tilletia horrida]
MSADEQESKWFRLPAGVKPLHYDLLLKSDLKAVVFQGVVAIKVEVIEDVQVIELNSAKLHLSKALLAGSNSVNDGVLDIAKDEAHGRASIKLKAPLKVGTSALLTIAFGAKIADDLTGYVRTLLLFIRYVTTSEEDGVKTTSALTQLAPVSARRAFPCWDEPGIKVECSFSMIHRSETVALANMPVKSTQVVDSAEQAKLLRSSDLPLDGTLEQSKDHDSEWTLTRFEKAPKMSSYLLTWANGPFKYLEHSYTSPITGKTIPLRIYATPSQISQAQFALDMKAKGLPIYEEIFGLAFPLPKLDTLVVSDFAFGAMEGFGLITGRTTAFLFDEKNAGLAAQRRSAEVQTHEVAHQWFGNLTTFVWWDNLWLNESFATLMGSVVVLDRLFPEWKVKSLFVNTQLARALELDAKRSSHPIEIPLRGENVEDGVNQIFDAISYAKGGSVLNMLSNMVGEATFLKGVSLYLKKHVWSNTVTKNLWEGISEASGIDIGKVMAPWILKQGFPVITVSEHTNRIKVRQNRFLLTGDVTPEEDETLWYVPLAMRTAQEDGSVKTDQSVVLDMKRELELPMPDAKTKVWKFNADTIGVYRVAYPPALLARLGTEAAKPDSIFTLEDRVGLVSDASTLARAGYSKTPAALDLIWTLRADKAYLVNDAIASTLNSLRSVWFEQAEEVREALKRLSAVIFGPLARRLGFDSQEGESSETRDLRTTAISAAASASDPWVLAQCKERFAPLLDGEDDSQIPKDLMQPIFRAVARNGGEREYEALLRLYRRSKIPSQKNAALVALCNSADQTLVDRTVALLFGGSDDIRQQDWVFVFMALASNPTSRRAWWAHFQKNWQKIYDAFEASPSLSRLVDASIGQLTEPADLDDVEAFFKEKETSKYSMGLQQGLDSIRTNSRWLKCDAADVAGWLKAQAFMS